MVAMLALYEAHAGWAILDGIEARFAGDSHIAKSATIRGGALRASATLEGPITAGFFLMLSFVAALGSRPFFRSGPVWLGACGLLLLGMIASQSRGDLIGLANAVLIMLLARRKFFWAFLASVVGGMAALGFRQITQQPGRVSALLDPHASATDYRTVLLTRGLQEGRKFPWLGTSYANVLDRLRDITQGEQIIDLVNSYLHIFLISGLVGLGACLVAMLLVYRNLVLVAMRSRQRLAQVEAAFFIASFSALLASLATASFYGRIPWFLAMLAAGSRLLAGTLPRRKRVRKPEHIMPLRPAPA